MSELKISPNQFLEQQELDRFKKFLDTDGFRKLYFQNATNFGLVRKANEDFTNGLVQEDSGLTVKINPILAIDKNSKIISLPAISQLAIPADSNWYWLKISYKTTIEETGTFSIDNKGNLVCTSNDAELKTILRGQPNHPSRIIFTNAVNNIIEYDVLEVIDNNNAVLQGSFTAESDLKLAVVGTFTPGYVPLTAEKYIFQYDSCLLTLVSSNTIDPPAHTAGLEFIIGRAKNNGVSIKVEDRRDEIFQTEASYFQKYLDTLGNPLIGVEQVMYDDPLSPKVQNCVQVAWAFKATAFSVNLKLNTITIGAGSGGKFKTSNFSTEFTDGDFDGWRVYVSKGTYYKVQSSSKVASNIELIMENLSSNSFFSDFDSTTSITQQLIITPDVEEIEIIATADPAAASPINTKRFSFPINEAFGRIFLNVYATSGTLYNLKYRYKFIKEYSEEFILPDDSVGFYSETQFDSSGNLIGSPTQTPYVADPSNGYIPLVLHPDAYSIFENRIDLGDLLGVQQSLLSNATPLVDLTVGSSRQYQYWSDGDDSVSNDALTLSADMFINLKKINVNGDTCRNGNFFLLHFKQKVIANGFALRIVTDYVNPSSYVTLKAFNTNDFEFLASSEEGLFIRVTFDGTNWLINSVNEVRGNISDEKTLSTISTSSTSYVDMTGLNYTTPNDGITRKYLLLFKGVMRQSLSAGDGVWVAIYNNTSSIILDRSRAYLAVLAINVGLNEVVVTCQKLVTLGPNVEIKMQFFSISGGSVQMDENSLIILEQKN